VRIRGRPDGEDFAALTQRPELIDALSSCGAMAGATARLESRSSRVEFRMKVNSDATWMNAASSGLSSPTPRAYPQYVHDECAREVLPDEPPAAARDAHRFTNCRDRCDEHHIGALHRHRGARAHRYAHVACASAGASFTPSPIIATSDRPLQRLDMLLLLMRHQLGA